jgi:hypothetical protein
MAHPGYRVSTRTMSTLTVARSAPRIGLGVALRRHPRARRSATASILLGLIGLLAALAPNLPAT